VNPPLLELRGLTCRFSGQTVLDAIDLRVQHGERVALIGANGAGKSTLLQAISGLCPLHAGSIWLNGRRIDGLAPEQIARAGVARSFQTPQVYPKLSVADQLRCTLLAARRGGWLRRRAGDAALEHRVALWLQQLRLQPQADRRADELDDTSVRVLALGLALAADASLLVLDEPVAGMHRDQAERMAALIAQAAQQRTVLLVEHDLQTVFRLASRVVVLHHGRVLADSTPQAVRADPRVQAVYFGVGR